MVEHDIVPDHDQYMRLLKAAKSHFPGKRHVLLRNRLWSWMIKCASENPQVTDRRELKALLKARIENKAAGSGVIISAILWWILPKILDFFIAFWFRDKERGQSQSLES